MEIDNIGFIGAGRVVRIILDGLGRAGRGVGDVIVSDPAPAAREKLEKLHPGIELTADNKLPASRELIFVAVHPPVAGQVFAEISSSVRQDAVIISLVPKIAISAIRQALDGFGRIVRMIPNAPSIVGRGYNPVSFSDVFSQGQRDEILEFLQPLGECPVVEEKLLEAYAIISGIGPTYLWFQLYELARLGESFGLSKQQAGDAVAAMTAGAAETMVSAGLGSEEVMDLIPLKPLQDKQDDIKQAYQTALNELFRKLSGQGIL